MRMENMKRSINLVVAALVVLFVGSRIAQARPNPTPLLRVLPQRSHVISGSTVPLKAVIENHFHVPLWVGNQDTPNAVRFWLAPDSRGPEGNIAATLQRTNVLTSMWYLSAPAVIVVSPLAKAWLYQGKSGRWQFSLSRLYDLTLPGRYRLRLITGRRLYSVNNPAEVARLTCKMPGGIVYWQVIPFPKISAGKAKLLPPLQSKRFTIRVLPPYGKTPASAIQALNHSSAKLPSARKQGLCVMLMHPAIAGPGPISVRVELVDIGRRPVKVHLAGDPLTDFGLVHVRGPSDLDRVKHLLLPKPHEVVVKYAVPPLTAYGKWLVKHPPKKLPEKTYDLKPGVVYKYVVPINLSCQYDMSLAGVYHVRVELAHPKIWSNWVTVKVPS